MKLSIERIPEGVRLTITPDGAKKPVIVVVQPGQLALVEQMLRTAMSASVFKFELQI